MKVRDRQRLTDEYKRLVRSLYAPTGTGEADQDVEYESFLEEHMASPILPDDQKLLETAMPGNIRKAEIFIMNLHKVVFYLDSYIR